MKTAVIAGATGLIGRQLLTILLEDEDYNKVYALGRNKINLKHPKLVQEIVDFNNLSIDIEHIDDVFCCLGTTIKKAGSQEKFRLVDFQYPVNLAEYCLTKGARQYALVSSMGADENSSIFYNKVKGEVEKAIAQIGYTKVEIYRPSLLLGARNESRFAEDVGKAMMKVFGFIFIGPLSNYKAIESNKVSLAMQYFAKEENPGVHFHLSGELQKF